jgi:hypothetical protein
LGALLQIFQRKQRLEVGVMKTHPLLGGVKQIKTGAWADVVNVPNRSVVFPRHAGAELGFEVVPEFWD